MLFAERYEGSELCCRNALLLAQTQERDLSAPSPEVQAELAIKRETANPMYWGVWTLLRVRPMLLHIAAPCCQLCWLHDIWPCAFPSGLRLQAGLSCTLPTHFHETHDTGLATQFQPGPL